MDTATALTIFRLVGSDAADWNAKGTFTVPGVEDLSYFGHTSVKTTSGVVWSVLVRKARRAPASRCVLRTVSSGGSP